MSLKARKDGVRFLLPKEFLLPEITEKYTRVLKARKGFFTQPIEYLNESIQQVQAFGFNGATEEQAQTVTGSMPDRQANMYDRSKTEAAAYPYPATSYMYRAQVSPLSLLDRTFSVYFRHMLGYLNYFMLFENFFLMYTRDTKYDEIDMNFNLDILNEHGSVYSRVVLQSPLMNAMEMVDFNFKQPTAQPGQFKVDFKYSNFNFQFMDMDGNILKT